MCIIWNKMSSKLDKEHFVSGHGGTSLGEIYLLTVTLIAGYLLRCVIIVLSPVSYQNNALFSFLTEYCTLIVPGVLVFTVLADYTLYVLVLITATAVIVAVYTLPTNINSLQNSYRKLSTISYPGRLPCVTLTRSFVTLITAIAILAVDFHIFPRRLAKAETYGTGLMDVGVGAFILSHGLTAPEARNKKSGYFQLVVSTIRGLLPLIGIGALRLWAVKSTEYQEHVTEYGVHWNFFFTIAAVRLLATLLYPVLNTRPHLYGLASLLIAMTYQVALSELGLSDYIQHGPNGDGSRPTLLSANREGIWSCVGYLAIYLGHVEIGRWLFRSRRSVLDYVPVLVTLLCLSGMFYCGTVLADAYIEPASRRIVNLAYICWIFSYGALIVGLFLLTDLITYTLSLVSHSPHLTLHTPHLPGDPHKPRVCITSAVDYNQLGLFLLANLLTGMINLTMDTLHANWATGLTVLLVYMTMLVCVFIALFRLKIKIKL